MRSRGAWLCFSSSAVCERPRVVFGDCRPPEPPLNCSRDVVVRDYFIFERLLATGRPNSQEDGAVIQKSMEGSAPHFGPGPACDSVPNKFNSRPVRNSLPYPAFNPDFATSHNSDLDEAGKQKALVAESLARCFRIESFQFDRRGGYSSGGTVAAETGKETEPRFHEFSCIDKLACLSCLVRPTPGTHVLTKAAAVKGAALLAKGAIVKGLLAKAAVVKGAALSAHRGPAAPSPARPPVAASETAAFVNTPHTHFVRS
ncbi:hypothetical protein EVAR_13913_1 [Eumeta japonica]|uniref:Uncharacterized protein n=1 Tax=Eumeta variegata TaxID=151549 RepID=A0A4C1U886_EUMVA|nr:hypothetical protein EVAR_13913_1 [Eumeta japonica]